MFEHKVNKQEQGNTIKLLILCICLFEAGSLCSPGSFDTLEQADFELRGLLAFASKCWGQNHIWLTSNIFN